MKKRHTETENYLKQALAKLLLEKNFEEVTVSDTNRGNKPRNILPALC